MGPVTGRSKGRSQRRTEHPSPPDRTGAVCCERGVGASLTSTCCQNLWPSFLDQVYGCSPPLLHSFIKCLLRACCIWVPSSMLPIRDKDCCVCGVRQSAVTLNARARCCAEGGGRRMGAQVPGAGPWCRCTWRKGLRARRPRPARKPPGEPAEPRGPGARPCRLVFCCRLLPPLCLPFFLFKFSTKPEIELIHQTDVI